MDSENFDFLVSYTLDPSSTPHSSTLSSLKLKLSDTSELLPASDAKLTAKINEFEKLRITSETWFHVKIPYFYASVEAKQDPRLENIPIAIGDTNIICQQNKLAHEQGVRSNMKTSKAYQLCRNLVLLYLNYPLYQKEIDRILGYLKTYDQNVSDFSLGEASLWMTQETNPIVKAQEIIDFIYNEFQLEATVGIGCNKLIAKLASNSCLKGEIRKIPNNKEEILKFLENTPLDVPGIDVLTGIGIATYGDVLTEKNRLACILSEGALDALLKRALGIGHCFPDNFKEKTGISLYKAFSEKTSNIENSLKSLCKTMTNKLIEKESYTKELTLTVQTAKNETFYKSERLIKSIQGSADLFNKTVEMYQGFCVKDPVKLVKICADSLESKLVKSDIFQFYKQEKGPRVPVKQRFESRRKPSAEPLEFKNYTVRQAQEPSLKRKREILAPQKKAKFNPLFTMDKFIRK